MKRYERIFSILMKFIIVNMIRLLTATLLEMQRRMERWMGMKKGSNQFKNIFYTTVLCALLFWHVNKVKDFMLFESKLLCVHIFIWYYIYQRPKRWKIRSSFMAKISFTMQPAKANNDLRTPWRVHNIFYEIENAN